MASQPLHARAAKREYMKNKNMQRKKIGSCLDNHIHPRKKP